MKHQLPQFIDIEDKIFGPFTFKQFVYLAGGAGLAYIIWRLLPALIAIVVIVPVVSFALALAFYKVNNRPFILTVQAMFTHTLKNKFYLWKKVPHKKEAAPANAVPAPDAGVPTPDGLSFRESKLRNMAWSLDVLDMADDNATRDQKKFDAQR